MYRFFLKWFPILFFLNCGPLFAQSGGCSYSLDKFDFHYKARSDNVGVALIGDSIIRSADWQNLLRRSDVVNLGISGDNIYCIKNRISFAIKMRPKLIVLEGGINDLPSKSVDYIFDNYVEIIGSIRRANIVPILILVGYLGADVGDRYADKSDYKSINNSIKELNDRISSYAKLQNIEYIDVNSDLQSDGVLDGKFTADGLHLNQSAYSIVATALLKIFGRIGF